MWARLKTKGIVLPILLMLYHLGITCMAYQFALSHKADANKYWFRTVSAEKVLDKISLPLREHLLYSINYILAEKMSLPFWFGFLLYATLGLIGILILIKIIRNITGKQQIHWIFLFLLFLPSMHFWTSFIGKEPIVFLGLAMAFYALSQTKIHAVYLGVGLLLVGLIRPQMAAIFIFCLGIAFLFYKSYWSWKYILFFGIIGLLVFIGLTQASWFSSFSWDAIQYYIDVHHWQLSKSKAYVPLEDYPWIYKLFSFYFRPLPGEMPGIYGYLQGIENVFLLLISGFGIFALIQNKRKSGYPLSLLETSIILFSLFSAIILSLAYSNFGLISRMKNMFMPFMLMILVHWILIYLNPLDDAKRKTN